MRWLPKDEASNSAFFCRSPKKVNLSSVSTSLYHTFLSTLFSLKICTKMNRYLFVDTCFLVCSKMVPFFQGNRIEIMRDTIFPIFCCLQTIKIGGRKNQCVHQLLPQVSVKVGLSLYFLCTSNFNWITRKKTRSMPCHHYTHTSLFLFGRKCE